MQEKIRCEFCGRKNSIDEDLCLSCGAVLPDIPPLRSLKFRTVNETRSLLGLPDISDIDPYSVPYLNELGRHSAFAMSTETGRLVGLR